MSTRPTAELATTTPPVVVRIEQAAPDGLIAFPFVELGISERAAAVKLAARVEMVKLGRKKYARRSALLAAVDALAAEQRTTKPAAPSNKTADAYGALVALAGGRR